MDVECFNSIISVANILKESAELRWKLVTDTLNDMKEREVNPNLGTMNACLSVISRMGVRNARNYALQILAEFKQIGIEPSLGSYCHILNTFCSDRGPVSHVLLDIMNEIEKKDILEIRDIKDTHFFMTAMEVARYHLFDANLAKRINTLLHKGENYNLIGDSYKESAYYRNYFSLLVQTEPLESFMNDYYHYLVPHVYIPEPSVTEDILKAIEANEAIEHLPLMWSHMICFDQVVRENLISLLMKIMVNTKPSGNAEALQKTNDEFGKIAWDIWTKIEEKNQQRSKPIVWTGKLLGDILRLVVRTQNIDNAAVIMEKIWSDQQKILGEPEFVAMDEYVQLCILKKEPSKAINCLQYCTEILFEESQDLARKILRGFTLDENHLKKVVNYVGQDVVSEIEKEQEEKTKQVLK
jgi:pentatricopeptide repeat domain-containing protein 3